MNNICNIKHFLLAIAFIGFALPSQAEFGRAVTEDKPLPKPPTAFTAWCAEKYADCSVEFDGDRIVVDGDEGVKRSRIIRWRMRDDYREASGFIGDHHLYNYIFTFINAKGDESQATLVFQNAKTSDKFRQRLRKWVPGREVNCRYNFDVRRVVCKP